MNGSRILLYTEKSDHSSISSYFAKLKLLWDEFSSLRYPTKFDCPSFKKYAEFDQQQKLLQFLLGLNESYSGIKSQILLMNPLTIVNQAYSLVNQEELNEECQLVLTMLKYQHSFKKV